MKAKDFLMNIFKRQREIKNYIPGSLHLHLDSNYWNLQLMLLTEEATNNIQNGCRGNKIQLYFDWLNELYWSLKTSYIHGIQNHIVSEFCLKIYNDRIAKGSWGKRYRQLLKKNTLMSSHVDLDLIFPIECRFVFYPNKMISCTLELLQSISAVVNQVNVWVWPRKQDKVQYSIFPLSY